MNEISLQGDVTVKDLTEIKGFVVSSIDICRDDEELPDSIIFHLSNGEKYMMFHEQDCCESVWIEDIEGDIKDILGNLIIVAEETTHVSPQKERYESISWTFYRIATAKGFVVIRWCGTSNGYYSEAVSLYKLDGHNEIARLA